ncbi:hypothetical protein AB0L41_42595 [Amycolatopsis mediterranei]|uniref:hypothetical protein n=1 Tax=Amycolatopsis mediterranei TaxID=33910 RepID=UPI003432F656
MLPLRRILLLGIVILAAALSVATPASAGGNLYHIRSFATQQETLCLDSNGAEVYTTDCADAPLWELTLSGGGLFQIKLAGKNACLGNEDYFTVGMFVCSIPYKGDLWRTWDNGNSTELVNYNTDRYLSTDFSRSVYLAEETQNQTWFFDVWT